MPVGHDINGVNDDDNPTHFDASWGVVPQVSEESELNLDEKFSRRQHQCSQMKCRVEEVGTDMVED